MSDLIHTIKVGQLVSFRRNSVVKSDSTPVVSLVPVLEGNKNIKQEDLGYVIEHENGWIPNTIRKEKFGLSEAKKYLFVSESELTVVE